MHGKDSRKIRNSSFVLKKGKFVYKPSLEIELGILHRFLYNAKPQKTWKKVIGYGLSSKQFSSVPKTEKVNFKTISRQTFSKRKNPLLEYKLISKNPVKKTKPYPYSITPLGIFEYFSYHDINTKKDIKQIIKICDSYLREHIHKHIMLKKRIDIPKFENFLDKNNISNTFLFLTDYFHDNIHIQFRMYTELFILYRESKNKLPIPILHFFRESKDDSSDLSKKNGVNNLCLSKNFGQIEKNIDDSLMFHHIACFLILLIHYAINKNNNIKISDYNEIKILASDFQSLITPKNRMLRKYYGI